MLKWHSLSRRLIVTTCLVIITTVSLVFAVPTVAQENNKLFNDDFESGNLALWKIFTGGDGQASIKKGPDGGHWLSSINNVSCVAGNSTWTDYQLKGKLLLLEGKAKIRVRFNTYLTEQGKVSDYYTVVLYSGGYSLLKGREQQDYPEQLTELASTAAPIKLNSSYLLGVSCQGDSHKSTLSVQLLDEQLNKLSELRYEDKQAPIPSGQIVLGTLDKSQALFDNVAVVQMAAPALTTPAPAEPTKPEPTAPTTPAAPALTTPGPAPTTPESAVPTPVTQQPSSGPSVSAIAASVSATIAVFSFVGYLIARRVQNRQKRHLKKLLEEIDVVYTRFKMNTRRCEAELYRLQDVVTADLKEGRLEAQSYAILDKRLDNYMKEVQERIIDESLGTFPSKLKDSLHQLMEKGEMNEYELAAIEKIILSSNEVPEVDKIRLRESLERWRKDYLKKGKASQPDL